MFKNRNYMLLQLFTGSRLLFALLFAIILIPSDLTKGVMYTAILFALCAEITDFLDGKLARKFSLTSSFGKYFDPLIDSLSRLAMFFVLAIIGIAPLWLPILMSFRDIIVTYLRIFALEANFVMGARMSGKVKAWAQGIGVFLLLVNAMYVPTQVAREFIQSLLSVPVAIITIWSLFDYLFGIVKLLIKRK